MHVIMQFTAVPELAAYAGRHAISSRGDAGHTPKALCRQFPGRPLLLQIQMQRQILLHCSHSKACVWALQSTSSLLVESWHRVPSPAYNTQYCLSRLLGPQAQAFVRAESIDSIAFMLKQHRVPQSVPDAILMHPVTAIQSS